MATPPAPGCIANILKHWSIFRVIVWDQVRLGDTSCHICRRHYMPNDLVAFNRVVINHENGELNWEFYHSACLFPDYDRVGVCAIPPARMLPGIRFPQPLEADSGICAVCLKYIGSSEQYWYHNMCKHSCHLACNPNLRGRNKFCPAPGCFYYADGFKRQDAWEIFQMDEDILAEQEEESRKKND